MFIGVLSRINTREAPRARGFSDLAVVRYPRLIEESRTRFQGQEAGTSPGSYVVLMASDIMAAQEEVNGPQSRSPRPYAAAGGLRS